jgi:hypothetical protein
MKKTGLYIAIGAIVFMAIVVYSTMGLRKHRVEVCMEFNGKTNCRTASGETPERAKSAAIQNACALIASGVGDSIACQNKPPVSLKNLN